MITRLIVILMFLLSLDVPVKACTIFSASKGGEIFAAKNQDYHITDTRMLLIPSNGQNYGVIHFGDKNPEGFCNTSGMNDQGLWYAGASVPERNDISNHYNKHVFEGELIEKVMNECADVEQAIEMFSTYYTSHWNGHFLLCDKHGNSVIVEYGEKDVTFIHGAGDYQVATNFYLCDTLNSRWYRCYRYDTANYMLENSDTISIDLFRSICDATHAEGKGPTVLSTIHDLITGDIYIYDFHNYDEVVIINLYDELKKGEQYCKIPDYFHHIKLRKPEPDEQVDPDFVKFKWNGDGDDYMLYCSTDPAFKTCQPVEISSTHVTMKSNMEHVFLFAIIVLMCGLLIRKKMGLSIFLCLIILFVFLSCELDILEPPSLSQIEHSYILEDLEPNSTYYWKVMAVGKNGINSQSSVQSLETRGDK